MAISWFLLALLVAGLEAQTFQNPTFQVIRAPMTGSEAMAQATDKICTAIYLITLQPQYTTQGNDLGMLQPHGINSTGYGALYPLNWANSGVNINNVGADYSKYPFPNDVAKQSLASSMFSVTALTDPTGTPIGFKMETMRMYYSVCVQVRGVFNRWVEIMAQTPQPDRKICVSDWKPDNTVRSNMNANPFLTSCGQGHLYSCRGSPNEATSTGFADTMNIRFYGENTDDESYSFYWRVVASQLPPVPSPFAANTYVQPDGEMFCLYRKGTDYPSSLLRPYPQDYVPPPVFELSTSSAMSLSASLVLLGSVVILFLAL